MKTQQNTPPFMAEMSTARAKRDTIPPQDFQETPLFKAGTSVLGILDIRFLDNKIFRYGSMFFFAMKYCLLP
jgi:hypothetical protein